MKSKNESNKCKVELITFIRPARDLIKITGDKFFITLKIDGIRYSGWLDNVEMEKKK
jgi:hypothetical protein